MLQLSVQDIVRVGSDTSSEKKCVYTHLSTRTYGRMYPAGDSVHRGITCMHGPPSTATAVTRQPS